MIEEKIASLGIKLPNPPIPAGSYVPVVRSGNLLFVSGQIPIEDGKVAFTGKVSEDNLDIAQKSARLCAINILAQLKKELGNPKEGSLCRKSTECQQKVFKSLSIIRRHKNVKVQSLVTK